MRPVSLVLHYSNIATHALRVVAGALGTDPRTRGVAILFAQDREALITAIQHALTRSRKVVIGWSFYSPQFGSIGKELGGQN